MKQFASHFLSSLLLMSICAVLQPADALDAPDPARGPLVFQQCVACHSLRDGGQNRVGPNLFGLLDRGIAAKDDFAYSKVLQARMGQAWTPKLLNAFIAKPHQALPGSNMKFTGILNPHDRADLLAWFETATRDPNLPEDVDIPAYKKFGGDARRGERLTRACRVCHNHKPNSGHKIGPNLYGVMGRMAGSAEGFAFSEKLEQRGVLWTAETLQTFFEEYKEFSQGTHRAFKSLRSPQDRADVIAWLATLRPQPEGQEQ